MTYGYIRVSSTDQNEARQWAALRSRGIQSGRIYVDKQSGKDFQRPEYQRLVAFAKTETLALGASQTLELAFPLATWFAS